MQTFMSYLLEQGGLTAASADTKGKLHELLVGHHLQGGKHMENHANKEGESPKQAHDRLKATISTDEYKKINDRAKKAADDIRSHVEKGGHKIHTVHWTSKPGDLHKSTGIHASQKEDASDVVIHTKGGGKIKHHGVSLKVSDNASKHLPVTNTGVEAIHKGQEILDKHRASMIKEHPQLGNKNRTARKEFVKSHPAIAKKLHAGHVEALKKMVDATHEHLSKMSKADLANHVRTHILAAHKTPMEKAGHTHIRHTAYMTSKGQEHHAINPHEHYNQYLNDHKNLSVEKSGTSIYIKHKGVRIARHAMKFRSQSDPMSQVNGRGFPLV